MSEALWPDLQRSFHLWSGNRLRGHSQQAALDALEKIARQHRLSADACLRALEIGELPGGREALVESLVNRTTWFLRDAKGLEALVEQMLVRQKPDVRVWVAGCSTGQEPYTLTMALLDAGLRPRILATDISRDALRVAAEGRYRSHELTRVPTRWKANYFVATAPDEMRIVSRVRDCITFQYGNLAAGVPSTVAPWDAVVCRNVLLHFEREHAAAVIRSLNAVTELLLLSPVEQPLAWISKSKRLDIDEVVLLRGDQRAPATASPARQAAHRARTEPPVIVERAPSQQVSDLVGRACVALSRGEIAEALALCDAAIAADRLFPAAHLAKGLALRRSAKFAEAVPVLRCARFLTSDEAWLAPYTLARCLEHIGDREAAHEAYRHAIGVIDGGGVAGLAPWDVSMDALARTVGETCRARLLALR
jgi:chemotaxis methyl-accepting protein methylase